LHYSPDPIPVQVATVWLVVVNKTGSLVEVAGYSLNAVKFPIDEFVGQQSIAKIDITAPLALAMTSGNFANTYPALEPFSVSVAIATISNDGAPVWSEPRPYTLSMVRGGNTGSPACPALNVAVTPVVSKPTVAQGR
jgi:hypothetical protein